MTGRRKLSMQQSIYLSTYLIIYLCIHPCIHPCLYLSIHPSIYVSLPISLSLPLSLSPYLSIYLSIDRSIYLSIYPCIHPSINPSIYLSLCISLSIYQTCLSIYLSICPYIKISIYLPINQSIYPSIDLSGYLSIYLSIYLAIYLFNQSINNPSILHEWVSKWVSELVSEWVSEWVSTCIVPRLPRKRGGAPRDARAYIRPFGNAHCLTPAMQKRRSPKGRQGVHLTPWQCTLSHACHAKAAEPQGTPGRTSDPLAVHVDVRLPCKSGGAPRDARAYIWPLGSAHCPTPATQKRRSPTGRQGVHQTPWQCTLSHACHAKEAEPQGTPGRTSDPLAVHIVPRLPRKRGGAPRDARAYIRPLGSADCPTPATQKRRSPKGRQGVHQTPWQCTLSDACHAKEAEPQETPGRTSDPLAVHIVPRLPRKRSGAPRDARAYIRPLGSAHCPTPATQKRRSPKGRQGVHPTPWQCTWQCLLSHACHAKAAEPQGTPGRTSNPLAVHIVPRLPRKMHIGPRLPREWVSEWVSESVSEWVSECVSEWVSVWVSEWEWVSGWLSGGRRREAAEGGGRRIQN